MTARKFTVLDMIPRDWTHRLKGGRVAVGVDQATTDGKLSNPMVIAVVEEGIDVQYARLTLRFKTSDPFVGEEALGLVLDDLAGSGVRPVNTVIDASNETWNAKRLAATFQGKSRFRLIKSGETWNPKEPDPAKRISWKTYLNEAFIARFEDGKFLVPDEEWLATDLRLLLRVGGGFKANLSADGGHNDCFDAYKLGSDGLHTGVGPARGMQLGNATASGTPHDPDSRRGRFWTAPCEAVATAVRRALGV